MNVIHALSSLGFFPAGENIDSHRDKRWKADSRRSRDFYHVKRLFDLEILGLIHISVDSRQRESVHWVILSSETHLKQSLSRLPSRPEAKKRTERQIWLQFQDKGSDATNKFRAKNKRPRNFNRIPRERSGKSWFTITHPHGKRGRCQVEGGVCWWGGVCVGG